MDATTRLVTAGPMPLALLAQRARNSKTGGTVLQNGAHYLGEAGAALAAAYWLGRLRARGPVTPEVARALEPILRRGAGFGHWVGVLRASVAAVSPQALDALTTPLSKPAPLDALGAALDAELGPDGPFGADGPGLGEAWSQARKGGVLGFLNFLVAFRNRAYGHGAMLPEATCRALARPFLEAVSHVLLEPALFEKRWLGRTGLSWPEAEGAPHWKRFHGTTIEFLAPGSAIAAAAPVADPSTLHFVGEDGDLVPLAPLVLQQEDVTGLSFFGFFLRPVRERSVTSVEYVDYIGRPFRDDTTVPAVTTLLAEIGTAWAGPADAPVTPPPPAARRFGDFVIEEELGRGSSGIVYRATQLSLDRIVALKVLAPTFVRDPVALGRFRREVHALSHCDHPNVVRILAHGIEEGRPWYAMEYVDGIDLSELFTTLVAWKGSAGTLSAGHLLAASSSRGGAERGAVKADAGSPPSVPERPKAVAQGGRIYRSLARVFAGAAEGLAAIHRSGIIHRDVKPANLMLTNGAPRLVVMDLGLAKTAEQSASLTGQANRDFVGSARYAAPEQLQSRLLPVDARADVYALGATLYELATLAPFYPSSSIEDLLRRKLQVDPPAPRTMDRDLPADLDTIIRKATARIPESRYATAEDLARDLRAFAHDRPITARPPGRLYYLRLFYRRNRGLVHLGAAAGVLVVAAVAGGFAFVTKQRLRAEQGQLRERSHALVAQAGHAADSGRTSRALLLAAEACRTAPVPQLQQALRAALALPFERAILHVPGAPIVTCTFAPDGTQVLTADAKGVAQLWSLDGVKGDMFRGGSERLAGAAFSPDGRRILTWSLDGTARIFSRDGLPTSVLHGGKGRIAAASFSPDGAFVLTQSADFTAAIWDVTGQRRATFLSEVGAPLAPPWSSDSSRVIGIGTDGAARVWGRAGESLHVVPLRAPPTWAFFLRDGSRLAVGSLRDTLVLLDAKRQVVADLSRPAWAINAVARSADGELFAVGSDDRSAYVWDADGREVAVLRGHEGAVLDVSFSSDSSRVVTASQDGTVRVWSRSGHELWCLRGHDEPVVEVQLSPDGLEILSLSQGGTARIWDLDRREVAVLRGHGGAVSTARFSRDGARIVTASADGTARAWEADGRFVLALTHARGVNEAVFLPDGRIATASEDGVARIWTADGTEAATLSGHEAPVRSVRASPDGRRLLTASDDGTVRTWSTDDGLELGSIALGSEARFASFAPDGQRIVAGGGTTGRILDADGRSVATLNGHWDSLEAGTFAPDGQHVLTVARDRTWRTWSLDGREVDRKDLPAAFVRSAVHAGDGESLLLACEDGKARRVHLDGRELVRLEAHDGAVLDVDVSPDGTRIVTASADGTARVWLVAMTELEELARRRLVRDFTPEECVQYGEWLTEESRSRACSSWGTEGASGDAGRKSADVRRP